MVHNWQTENANEVVTKTEFASLAMRAFSAINADCIKNGFRACGLNPLDVNSVDYTKCMSKLSQIV